MARRAKERAEMASRMPGRGGREGAVPDGSWADGAVISTSQLARLGLSQLAYVRPVMMDGQPAWAIHGADGEPMAVASDRDTADEAIEQQDLVQVPLH